MGRQTLSPESFGKAAAAWNDEFFEIRICNESDPDRLRAVARYEDEREGETRSERVGMAMERLQKVK